MKIDKECALCNWTLLNCSLSIVDIVRYFKTEKTIMVWLVAIASKQGMSGHNECNWTWLKSKKPWIVCNWRQKEHKWSMIGNEQVWNGLQLKLKGPFRIDWNPFEFNCHPMAFDRKHRFFWSGTVTDVVLRVQCMLLIESVGLESELVDRTQAIEWLPKTHIFGVFSRPWVSPKIAFWPKYLYISKFWIA